MAVAQGYGKTVTSGSVFAYDVADTRNSYRGKPTTNFYTNGHFSGGTGIPQEGGSTATNTIIQLANPGNSPYVLQQTMGVASTEYQINLTNQLQSNTTYTLSGWYAESVDYVGASRMFHCRAFSTSGAHVALGTGIGTVLKTVEIGGLIWKYCYTTITTPADYSNDFNWYVGYDGGSYTGARYYTNLMMEAGTTPSQFVDGTRSATQGLLPLVGNSTLDLSNVSFDSNAQMTFDGTNDSIDTTKTATNLGIYDGPYTMEAVFKVTNTLSGDNIVFGTDQTNTRQGMHNGLRNGGIYFAHYSADYSAGSVALNEMVHVLWVYDGTTAFIYKNGVLQGSGNIGSFIGTTNIQVGRSWVYFQGGEIPVAKIYNRVLSAGEVRQNYLHYKTRFNLS
jgi:hypothetical protein